MSLLSVVFRILIRRNSEIDRPWPWWEGLKFGATDNFLVMPASGKQALCSHLSAPATVVYSRSPVWADAANPGMEVALRSRTCIELNVDLAVDCFWLGAHITLPSHSHATRVYIISHNMAHTTTSLLSLQVPYRMRIRLRFSTPVQHTTTNRHSLPAVHHRRIHSHFSTPV